MGDADEQTMAPLPIVPMAPTPNVDLLAERQRLDVKVVHEKAMAILETLQVSKANPLRPKHATNFFEHIFKRRRTLRNNNLEDAWHVV